MYRKIQKNLKFKVDGLTISASVEEPICFSHAPENSPIKSLHYHVIHELLIMGNEPLTYYSEKGIETYKNCILCIPPFLKHRTTRKSGVRILFTFDKEKKTCDFAAFMNSVTHAQSRLQELLKRTIRKHCHNLYTRSVFLLQLLCY